MTTKYFCQIFLVTGCNYVRNFKMAISKATKKFIKSFKYEYNKLNSRRGRKCSTTDAKKLLTFTRMVIRCCITCGMVSKIDGAYIARTLEKLIPSKPKSTRRAKRGQQQKKKKGTKRNVHNTNGEKSFDVPKKVKSSSTCSSSGKKIDHSTTHTDDKAVNRNRKEEKENNYEGFTMVFPRKQYWN